MKFIVVAGLAASLATSAAVSAQTLGAVARQEEERRKTVKTPSKVYTNDSLHPDTTSAPPPAAGAPGLTPATPDAGQPSTPPAADQAKDEAAWKKRIADARTALDRAQSFAEALQTRINSLNADFTSRDDPAQRAKIASDRTKALAELERLQKEILDTTKVITAIQEDARKAGVPAGWVR